VAVCAALLGTGTVFALDTLHHKGTPAVSALKLGTGSNDPAPMASGSPQTSPATIGTTTHHSGGGGRTGAPGTSPQASPSPSLSSSQPPGNPNPHPKPSPSQHPTSPPPSPPPSPGTLAVSPGTVSLTQATTGGPYTGSFTLTAQGGSVSSYSILDPAPAGDLSISPISGGTIADGSSVTVTITVASSSGLAFETDLTVDPGGLTVVVDYPPAG
jgi:hypothetical protein